MTQTRTGQIHQLHGRISLKKAGSPKGAEDFRLGNAVFHKFSFLPGQVGAKGAGPFFLQVAHGVIARPIQTIKEKLALALLQGATARFGAPQFPAESCFRSAGQRHGGRVFTQNPIAALRFRLQQVPHAHERQGEVSLPRLVKVVPITPVGGSSAIRGRGEKQHPASPLWRIEGPLDDQRASFVADPGENLSQWLFALTQQFHLPEPIDSPHCQICVPVAIGNKQRMGTVIGDFDESVER
ncbi:hypothetical protein HRbin36_01635 [bacterium HR36]|nr:hypothetical protein HRbin36_01635 [bacterium HR36]